MYKKITDPINFKIYSINSKKGIRILKKYIQMGGMVQQKKRNKKQNRAATKTPKRHAFDTDKLPSSSTTEYTSQKKIN